MSAFDMHVTTSQCEDVMSSEDTANMFRVWTMHRTFNHIGCAALGSTVADWAICICRSWTLTTQMSCSIGCFWTAPTLQICKFVTCEGVCEQAAAQVHADTRWYNFCGWVCGYKEAPQQKQCWCAHMWDEKCSGPKFKASFIVLTSLVWGSTSDKFPMSTSPWCLSQLIALVNHHV